MSEVRLAGSAPPVAVLAVDVGNSKTDVALVAEDGRVLAAVRGPTGSHQQVGVEGAMDALERLVASAAARAGLAPEGRPIVRPLARLGVHCMAGADLPSDVRLLSRTIRGRRLSLESIVLNDTHAALRAGATRPWGVAVICGAGVNCLGVGPTGRVVRFPALGSISGDLGGGEWLGSEALAAAVRGRDGRGPRTVLERLVPAHFGLRNPVDVTRSLYEERLAQERLRDLAPLVFAAATGGDPVARAIVDRQADEVVAMAGAAIRRLGVARRDVEVVLAGGIFRATDAAFYRRIDEGLARVAPAARACVLAGPPVLGAALLGLDRLALDRLALDRLAPDRRPTGRAEAEARLRAGLVLPSGG